MNGDDRQQTGHHGGKGVKLFTKLYFGRPQAEKNLILVSTLAWIIILLMGIVVKYG